MSLCLSLRYELNQYQPGLADRPNLLLGNKMDVPGAREKLEDVKTRLRQQQQDQCLVSPASDGDHNINDRDDNLDLSPRQSRQPSIIPVMGISAKHSLGIDELIHQLRVMYDTHSAGKTLYNSQHEHENLDR